MKILFPNTNYDRYYGYNKANRSLAFTSSASIKASTQKISSKVEYSLRVVGNKFVDLFQSENAKEIIKNISKIKPTQTKLYLEQLSEIASYYSSRNYVNVNLEDNILNDFAKGKQSAIFIMNHSNQKQDPDMLAYLIGLLTDSYKEQNVEEFPLPKIIMNEDILKTMNPTRREAFENFGAVGIDAALENSDKANNAKALLPIVKDFIRNKCNIFIFPEGRLAVRKDLSFKDRFQIGIASLVNKILSIKKEVVIIPVGFAYGKDDKKGYNAINIGTPICVKRNDDATTITKGDIEKDSDSPLYPFFAKNKDKVDINITQKGINVAKEDIPRFLKRILSENLKINSDIAKLKLNENFNEKDVEIV